LIGWPGEIDPTEAADQAKYAKKLYRDTTLGFSSATKEMVQGATNCMRQNNIIDLFQEYFAGEQPEHLSENITTKTLMIFKDPNQIKRSATSITWHPETAEMRVGVTYSMLRFQKMPNDMPRESYIWNLNNPNFPEKTLLPPSPLCTMAFNHKNSDIIVGGSYNGSLSFFDTRAGGSSGAIKPFKTTILEKSHHDPVYDVFWLTLGKTGNDCVSCSTDGMLHWWDKTNNDDCPIDSCILNEPILVDDVPKTKTLGATSLEYNSDAGPLKYLVGTEQGYIVQATKKKTIEITQRFGLETGKHHGPVYAIHRNPGHTKYFLSVGDWCAKIWSEELKSPIMQTRYHSAYLTDGCWSPTRCGLFFLTRIDGFLDVWDFYYRQNEICYSQKISDSPLTSISVNQNMAAIGDAEGTVSIM
jgi:dynein intermediate chain 2, axonemal